MKTLSSLTTILLAFLFVVSPAAPLAFAASSSTDEPLEVAAWIPYWKSVEGSAVAEENLDTLTMVNPFGYTVAYDGSLIDTAKLESSDTWEDLADAADDEDSLFIPTVSWTDGANIDRILRDEDLRDDHIDAIVDMVKDNRFDGVDIDYEGKLAVTKDAFSEFLKDLNHDLGSRKTLVCSIEARTPLESLYRVVPTNYQYANDLKAIGEYCDKVVIMAYDQGRADWQLNGAKSGAPYIPIADVDWVRKVATLAMADIPADKILLGVPTYGFEYEVTVSPNWFQSYRKLWSVSAPYAETVAKTLGITPERNKAGEMSFSYAGATTPAAVATYPGATFADKALAYANATKQTITFNLEWWSDAEAIEQKADLAQELGLAGIAIFRVDGTEDQEIWDMLAEKK